MRWPRISVLRVAVTAVPEGGKANAALIKLLAKRWRMAQRDLEVVTPDERNGEQHVLGARAGFDGVLVESDGSQQSIQIVDVTRFAQIALYGLALVGMLATILMKK